MTRRVVALFASLFASSSPLHAASRDLPYWASLQSKDGTVNMRVGPGEDYRIAWVYRRAHLPVKVVRRVEEWRLVQTPDGERGWVLQLFVSRERSAYVRGPGAAEMHAAGSDGAKLLWRLAPGLIGKLGECEAGWCSLDIGGHAGYVRAERLWGVGAP